MSNWVEKLTCNRNYLNFSKNINHFSFFFAFGATQNEVNKPIENKPKPYRPKKTLKPKNKKEETRKTYNEGVLILEIFMSELKTLKSTMKIADSKKQITDLATKPTKHKQTNLQFNFSGKKIQFHTYWKKHLDSNPWSKGAKTSVLYRCLGEKSFPITRHLLTQVKHTYSKSVWEVKLLSQKCY